MELLTQAANILDTSEYEVLRHAWHAWYGRPAPERQLQQAFGHCLIDRELPAWARAYAVQVVHRFEAEMRQRRQRRRFRWLLLGGLFRRPSRRKGHRWFA